MDINESEAVPQFYKDTYNNRLRLHLDHEKKFMSTGVSQLAQNSSETSYLRTM